MTTANNPEQQAFTREMKVILERAIDTLPDGQREVFMLREVEGLSLEETADYLGIPIATVKTRDYRARNMLRADLAQVHADAVSDLFEFLRERCDRIVHRVLSQLER